MAECNHDCSSCSSKCSEAESLLEPQNSLSNVKNVIAVVSGKGGVGKSLITSLMAVASRRRGYDTAIIDADITGPSIPSSFGIHGRVEGSDVGMFPLESRTGIKVMSINLLLESEDTPVVWRGPVIAGAVKQFWGETVWNDIDYMFVDMPPGTGDVPLTVFQSLPVKGIIVVTSPQDLVSMIVGKAVKMAELMKIPVLGIVENFSYFDCPDCGKRHYIYGDSHIDEIAAKFSIPNVARLPIDPMLAKSADNGTVELTNCMEIEEFADKILE